MKSIWIVQNQFQFHRISLNIEATHTCQRLVKFVMAYILPNGLNERQYCVSTNKLDVQINKNFP